jgi:hypothetical protein
VCYSKELNILIVVRRNSKLYTNELQISTIFSISIKVRSKLRGTRATRCGDT